MKNQKAKTGNRKSIKGFTIVECLIGLAIAAMLLAAVAVAFNASVVNYGENERMFWAINNARQALARMTSQLRTGHSVEPTADANECRFFTAADEDTTYEFDGIQRRLNLVRTVGVTRQTYLLCDDVVDARFIKTPTTDGTDCKSVQILLTVQKGDTRRTLSAAAVIRRNLGS